MAVVFDTYKQHKALTDAGFSEPQAQAITTVAVAVIDAVATKADVATVKADVAAVKADIERVWAVTNEALNGVNGRLDIQSKRISDIAVLLAAVLAGVLGLYAVLLTVIAPHLR